MIFSSANRLQNCRGSITLEATVVFPTIMMILFGLIFFSMFIYEKMVVLDTATYTSSQRAVTWDNSHKDLETGALKGELRNDGLYWRLFHDRDKSILASRKNLEAYGMAGALLGAGVFEGDEDIQISYDNRLYKRLVIVSVEERVSLPSFVGNKFGPKVGVTAVAVVAEPVEYIRLIDYFRYVNGQFDGYLDQFKNRQGPAKPVYITKNEYDELVYHSDPQCRHVKKISRYGNLKILESSQEAEQRNYRLCKHCAVEDN